MPRNPPDPGRGVAGRAQRRLLRQRTAVLAFVIPLSLCLQPNPAGAVQLFAPTFMPMAGHRYALDVNWSLVAFANTVAQSVSPSAPDYPEDWDAIWGSADAVVVASLPQPLRRAGANIQVSAQFGKLSALATAWAEHEITLADATAVAQYMDIVQVNRDGKLFVGFDMHGGVEAGGLPDEPGISPSFARSSASAETYVWPTESMPVAGQLFDFTYYARVDVTPEHGRAYSALGALDFRAGETYWVASRLEVGAAARNSGLAGFYPPHRVDATADFLHTFKLYIDPADGAADAGYTMASGFDYRTPVAPPPVPEPSTRLLLAGALGVACLRRIIRRRSPSPRVRPFSPP